MGLTVTVPLATPADAIVRLSGLGVMLAFNGVATAVTLKFTVTLAVVVTASASLTVTVHVSAKLSFAAKFALMVGLMTVLLLTVLFDPAVRAQL